MCNSWLEHAAQAIEPRDDGDVGGRPLLELVKGHPVLKPQFDTTTPKLRRSARSKNNNKIFRAARRRPRDPEHCGNGVERSNVCQKKNDVEVAVPGGPGRHSQRPA